MPSAVDTNIVVRFLVDDGGRQSATAKAVFEAGDIHIPVTVLLETEWVLRSVFSAGRDAIAGALERLVRMRGVSVADAETVLRAVGDYRNRLDFADALHLRLSGGADVLLTFDKGLIRLARRLALVPPVAAP